MCYVMCSSEAVVGTIDKQVNATLGPSLHRLGAVTSRQFKAKCTKQFCQLVSMRLIDGKFNESHVRDIRSGVQGGDRLLLWPLSVEQQKGAHAVDRDLLG